MPPYHASVLYACITVFHGVLIGPAYVFCILHYSGLAFGPFLEGLVLPSYPDRHKCYVRRLAFAFLPSPFNAFISWTSLREVGSDSAWFLLQVLFWRIGLGKRKT